jgi:hypothetical protein
MVVRRDGFYRVAKEGWFNSMKKPTYWVETREGESKMGNGVSIPVLAAADPKCFPYVVLTSESWSALGELVSVCYSREVANKICDALNRTVKKRKK